MRNGNSSAATAPEQKPSMIPVLRSDLLQTLRHEQYEHFCLRYVPDKSEITIFATSLSATKFLNSMLGRDSLIENCTTWPREGDSWHEQLTPNACDREVLDMIFGFNDLLHQWW